MSQVRDEILGHLHLARAKAKELEEEGGEKSRELSLTVTKVEEAVLWRERDLQIKNTDDKGAISEPIPSN